MDNTSREQLPEGKLAKAVVIGTFGGLLLVSAPYFITLLVKLQLAQQKVQLSHLLEPKYSISLLLILPLLQGLLAGVVIGTYKIVAWKETGTGFLIIVIDFLLAFLFFGEGYICLIIALPIYILFIALGLWIGRFLARYKKNKVLHSTLIPLVLLSVIYDTQYSPPYITNAISDAVIVNAPPEYVWRYIVQYPENTKAPEYWLWQIGLPEPIQSTATSASVRAERQCRFTHNITFKEQITELVPNKVLTFKVTEQPNHPEILGHFNLDKGQLYLEANPDGTTTVIATSWYRIFVKPSSYFDWWAADIVRNVHFRVLNHMKELAETDQQAHIARLE